MANDGRPYTGQSFAEAVEGNGFEGGDLGTGAFRWVIDYCKSTDAAGAVTYECRQRLLANPPAAEGFSSEGVQEFVGFIERACSRGSGDCEAGVIDAWRTKGLLRATPSYSPEEIKEDDPTELTFRLRKPSGANDESSSQSGEAAGAGSSNASSVNAAGGQTIRVSATTCFALRISDGSNVRPKISEVAGHEFTDHPDLASLDNVVCKNIDASADQPGDTLFLVKWLIHAPDSGTLNLEVVPVLKFDDGYTPKHTATKPVVLTVEAKPSLGQRVLDWWEREADPWQRLLIIILGAIAAIWTAIKGLPGFARVKRWIEERRRNGGES